MKQPVADEIIFCKKPKKKKIFGIYQQFCALAPLDSFSLEIIHVYFFAEMPLALFFSLNSVFIYFTFRWTFLMYILPSNCLCTYLLSSVFFRWLLQNVCIVWMAVCACGGDVRTHGPMGWWPSWISQHTCSPSSWWGNFSQQVKWDTVLHNLLFHP